MTPLNARPDLAAVAAGWWLLVLRGVVAILFGAVLLSAPDIGLTSLVSLWSGYLLADAFLTLVLAARGARAGHRSGWLLFAGIANAAAAAIALAWPDITGVILLVVIAFWAVVTGIAEVAAAIKLSEQVPCEWLLAANGILSVLFGLLLAFYRSSGALTFLRMIALYAVVFGALLILFGVLLLRWGRAAHARDALRSPRGPAPA